MANRSHAAFAAGFSLVWRRQRALWWVYTVNLALGIFATLPFSTAAGQVLNHSLYAARLYHGFDLATLAELFEQRGISASAYGTGSAVTGILFLCFMLFVTGGILDTYVRDQTLGCEEFFQSCGRCLWRFFRLMILLFILMIPADLVGRALHILSASISKASPNGELAFWAGALGWLVVVLLFMALRVWFDLAELHIAAANEHALRRALGHARHLLRGNFWYLYGVYLRISLLAYFGMGIALWIWIKAVRPEWVGVSFLLGQVVIFLWLVTRLWQRASESAWYTVHRPAPVEPEPALAAPGPVISL
jgi:hypothetical protein